MLLAYAGLWSMAPGDSTAGSCFSNMSAKQDKVIARVRALEEELARYDLESYL